VTGGAGGTRPRVPWPAPGTILPCPS
jgi:hypothetical protein